MGELETVLKSNMSVANYNNQTYLLYSKYGGDHSDVYGIPIGIESHIEPLDVYDFASWNGTFPTSELTTGTEETNPDSRTLMAKVDLNPYSSNSQLSILNSQLDFRFTYTGREFNIETGNYYYRFRTYDSMIGRYTSKDHYLSINKYFYADDDPVNYVDPMGLWTLSLGLKIGVGAAVGGSKEVGVSIGYSKECGFTAGTYSKSSTDAAIGLGGSASISLGGNSNKSVADNAGNSWSLGGSAKLGIFNVGASGGNAGWSISGGLGLGTPEGHYSSNNTKVSGGKGKCK